MNFVKEDILTLNRVSITNLLPEIGPGEVVNEIVSGLWSRPKQISSKFFYNREGSILFEEITRLKEYYPTRTEKDILKHIAPDLMNRYADYDIVELGPGDHSKISILLKAASEQDWTDIRYLPMDISQPALQNSAKELVSIFPNLQVEGYAVDFFSQFGSISRKRPVLICFFGSTIGNFEWQASLELLKNISKQMKKGDALLLGMDLLKPEPILYVAYNDSRGVTREFNLNILNNVNALIQSDFDTNDFDHLAFFNQEKSRIEMHLVAKREVMVHSPFFAEPLQLETGERIHTENSHKYGPAHIAEIVNSTGLHLHHTHTDSRDWFALSEFQKV